MLYLLNLGCAPQWCCWLFPSLRNNVTEESGSIQESTNKKKIFGVMSDHTCRILWSIKTWSKTVTISHRPTWFWSSFPAMGFHCCRNELIFFFFLSLCLPWVLLSAAEGGIFESIVLWHIYMINLNSELGEENLREMTGIQRLVKVL